MHRRSALSIFLISLIVGARGVAAQGKGQDKGAGKGKAPQAQKGSPAAAAKSPGFDTNEIRIIREWYSNPSNLKGLPPGLAKREQLPPGLQRQLAKNGKLPPGLEKKVQSLPRELELKLPRLPDGRKRIVIAGNVILLEERTATIVDILQNIF